MIKSTISSQKRENHYNSVLSRPSSSSSSLLYPLAKMAFALPAVISLLSTETFMTVDAIHGTSPSSSLPGSSLNPLIVKGTKFFDSVTGDEVVIKGVTYYPRPNDGYLNRNSFDFFTSQYKSIWERDIPYLQALGINAVRLYSVNATADHDEFMCAMNNAGIFVMVGLGSHFRTKSQSPSCYTPELKQHGINVINSFSKYANTLAFNTGNEVDHLSHIVKPEWNAQCQKKFIADMRRYIASCGSSSSSDRNGGGDATSVFGGSNYDSGIMRKIPVGLVVADTDRRNNAMYYNCIDEKQHHDGSNGHVDDGTDGSNDDDNVDNEYGFAEFYGINTYVDCNGTATTYDEFLGLISLQQSFESYNYSIPVLLTEFGCVSDTYPTMDGYEAQRTFLEASFLLERPELRDVFAGGFVFEYSTEAENAKVHSPYPFKKFGKQNYGLGYFSPEHCDDINQPCEYNPFPSSKYLLDAFLSFRTVNLTTTYKYEPPMHRRGRSVCPSGFRSIYNFTWEADTNILDECPERGELASYACSMESSQQYTRLVDRDIFSKAGMIVSVLCSVFIIVLVSLLTFRQRTQQHRHGYTPINDKGCE